MKEPQDCNSLGEIRSHIDQLDRSLISAISRRQGYVHAAARFKRSEDQVHAHDRQRTMLAARRKWAEGEGVDPDLIEVLFRTMVEHFVKAEMALFSDIKSKEAQDRNATIPNEVAAGGGSDGSGSKGS